MKKKSRPICRGSGKSIYPNEKSDQRGMMWIYSHDPNVKFGMLHTYPCLSCHKYHIGGTSEKYKH